jgi:DNA ligase-1
VFDIPTPEDDYEVRLASLKSIITSSLQPHTVLVGVDRCKSADDLQSKLKAVQNVGGEGLMIRKPRSKYEPGRSNALLKVKAQRDAEAQVVGYVFKDGSDSVVKALMCQIPNGNEIVMGGSLLAAEPQLPDIGAVVTYKYQVLGEDGSPKAPSFFRVRNDITWDDVMNASGSKTKVRVSSFYATSLLVCSLLTQ